MADAASLGVDNISKYGRVRSEPSTAEVGGVRFLSVFIGPDVIMSRT
jgi:hypothetical protein